MLLLLSWILCSLSSGASIITRDSLVASGNFSVLVDLSHLGVLLAKHISHLGEFLLHRIFRLHSALLLAVVAVIHTSIRSVGLIAIVLHGVILSILVLGHLSFVLRGHHGGDLGLSGGNHGFSSVEFLDRLNFRERSESLLVITEALLGSIWRRIRSIESIRGAGNRSGVVGINNGEAHTHNISEFSRGGLISFKTRRKVDVAITQAIITFIGASRSLIWSFNLAEALFIKSWKRIRSEFNN